MHHGMVGRHIGARHELPAGSPCAMWTMRRRRGGRHTGAFPWFPLVPMVFVGMMLLSRSLGGFGQTWVLVAGLLLLLAGLKLLATLAWQSRAEGRRAPEAPLSAQPAQNQVTRRQRQDQLVADLKARYVQGLIGLDDYEREVAAVFSRTEVPPAERPEDGRATV